MTTQLKYQAHPHQALEGEDGDDLRSQSIPRGAEAGVSHLRLSAPEDHARAQRASPEPNSTHGGSK